MTDPDDHDSEIAETFARVARLLIAEEGMERTLSKIAELAVETIDGCEHAGMSLVQRGKIHTPGSSDEFAKNLDAIQEEVGEGPCLDALRDHDVFQVDQLAEEQRWPSFARRAADQTGVATHPVVPALCRGRHHGFAQFVFQEAGRVR